jgi:hypothetical protein
MQPKSEFSASKSKGIQGKKLVFPWIPLVESGLFNGLQRKKIKKSPSAQLASWVVRTVARACRLALLIRSAKPPIRKRYTTLSVFSK